MPPDDSSVHVAAPALVPVGDLPPADPRAFSLEAELAVNSRLKREDLRALGEWLREEGLPVEPDVSLVKFLHSCEYDLAAAKACAKNFYTIRASTPNFFAKRDLSLPNLQTALDVTWVAVLPRRTPEGYRILAQGLKTNDTSNYVYEDVCKVLQMIVDSVFLTEPTVPGVVIIFDTGNTTFSHIWKFGIFLPRKFSAYSQTGMPIIQKDCHLVKCPSVIDKILKLVRHMGRDEDWARTFVHIGDDLSRVQSRFPADCLPRDYGGTLPSLLEIHDMTVRRLDCFRDFFAEEEKRIYGK